MRGSMYPKLAWKGIQTNQRLYVPYLLTCIMMVMMYYILLALQYSPGLSLLRGAETLRMLLQLGSYVVAFFSVLLLFYTNSFLMRRRRKEFGLYNILGMGKRHIGWILFWETVMITGISLVAGLGAGMAFSKLGELILVNMLDGAVSYELSLSVDGVWKTLVVFCVTFLLIFLNSLRQIHISNPVTLLRSENFGEKPPKANWLFGLLGMVILGTAYTLALSIEEPLSALIWFFVAVLMVIVATYLLFTAGSVLLCKVLQKNKKYYYKANHFVSVSSMTYRMKRNGAGLASICILATMVLVMISGSACLYFGMEDSLRERFPRDIVTMFRMVELSDIEEEKVENLRTELTGFLKEYPTEEEQVLDYRYVTITGYLKDGVLEWDASKRSSYGIDVYDSVDQVYFIPLSDYNRMMKTSEILNEDEVLLYSFRVDYKESSFKVRDGKEFYVKEILDEFFANGVAAMDVIPSVFVVVPDLEAAVSNLLPFKDAYGNQILQFSWLYGFDLNLPSEKQIEMYNGLREMLRNLSADTEGTYCSAESLAANRADFLSLYGGLFFLGIMLSVVFLIATVLILYYKQISEGYEDSSRFAVMQKVGMTKEDIKRSINSQMLTVFLLPILIAVVHLAFAFPIISKLLMLFNMSNVLLFLVTTGISVLVFTVFYMLVYRITSQVYYSIVSNGIQAQLT